MFPRRHLLTLLLCLLSSAWGPLIAMTDFSEIASPGKHRLIFRVDQFDRRVIVVTPANLMAKKPLPVVFFFHGAGSSADGAWRNYEWAEKANIENFYAVFPEGLPFHPTEVASFRDNPRVWRDGRSGLAPSPVDDFHFFEVLLAKVEAAALIDPRRIYLTGFSNGGGMTFSLGQRFSDRVAAIAPLASHCPTSTSHLARPVSVLYMTGTEDPLNPVHGGKVKMPWGNTAEAPPLQASIDLWLHLDGCSPVAATEEENDAVEMKTYGPGDENAVVTTYYIDHMGHHWPGTKELLPESMVGPVRDPFSATEIIWNFFVNHPMPRNRVQEARVETPH